MQVGHLSMWDFIVIGVYFVVTIAIGLSFSHKAGRSVEDFFLAGRKLTWWMAGGSMVATMFASDTPLFHCGNVRDMGLSAGWLFFLPMFGAMAAAAWFARWVRRTRVVTDAEFIELRYSGKAPAPFRCFMAIYSGIFVAALTMGWVAKGMVTVTSTLLPVDPTVATVVVLSVVTIYAIVSGMWGVVMADMFQYGIAAIGSLFLAIVAVHSCGGLAGLREGLAAVPGFAGSDLHFLPTGTEHQFSTGAPFMTWPLLIAWVTVYSIGQAGATAHQGQRVLACKTEKDASLCYVFFAICYYALNGLSWIIIGLASIKVLGATNAAAGITESGQAFPAMIGKLMPVGMKGLMVASIIAACMSCSSVLLNWGSSYLVNDVYRRFIKTNASQKHYVAVSRLASLTIAILGGLFCASMNSLGQIFSIVPMLLTGATVVLITRYLWWRTNIYSEISAAIASPLIGLYVTFVVGSDKPWLAWLPFHADWTCKHTNLPAGVVHNWEFFGEKLMTTVALTTIVWVIVTFLTKPTDMDKLKSFYLLVRPTGPGWWHVRKQFDNPPQIESGWVQLGVWTMAITFVLGAIISVVELVRGGTMWFIVAGIISIIGAVCTYFLLNRLDEHAVAADEAIREHFEREKAEAEIDA